MQYFFPFPPFAENIRSRRLRGLPPKNNVQADLNRAARLARRSKLAAKAAKATAKASNTSTANISGKSGKSIADEPPTLSKHLSLQPSKNSPNSEPSSRLLARFECFERRRRQFQASWHPYQRRKTSGKSHTDDCFVYLIVRSGQVESLLPRTSRWKLGTSRETWTRRTVYTVCAT